MEAKSGTAVKKPPSSSMEYKLLALPLGELSPQVTERALHSYLPSPSSLRSATSPIGRGKGYSHSMIQGQAQQIILLCLLTVLFPRPFTREPLIKSARAVSERFFGQSRYRKRRNTVCISCFRYRRVDEKDPLTAADDLFRGSLGGSFYFSIASTAADSASVFTVSIWPLS